jgi:hypothetical protein
MDLTELKDTTDDIKDIDKKILEDAGFDVNTKSNLLRVTEKNYSSEEFLQNLVCEIARECDALQLSRDAFPKDNKQFSEISVKRVHSLKLLADIYFQKKKTLQELDITSPEMNIVIKSLVTKFKLSLEEAAIDKSMIKDVFQNLDRNLEAWETEMEEQLEAYRKRGSIG